MKKIYYLKSCSTCKRIIKELNVSEDFIFQNIKENPLNDQDLEILKNLSGSYEALFSKRSNLYKELKLKERKLTELDYKKFLLEHYTFLKRPVVVIGSKIFIGNSPETTMKIKQAL